MATRFVNKGPIGTGTGNAHGFSADDNGVLVHDNGSTQGLVGPRRVKIITASTTATEEDNGTLFIADSTTSVIVTLPATRAGLTFFLAVGQLTSTGGHAFSPAAVDLFRGNGLSKADDADLVCTAATDRVGDFVGIVGDGSVGWYITDVVGTWA